jgi:hypothetical protein
MSAISHSTHRRLAATSSPGAGYRGSKHNELAHLRAVLRAGCCAVGVVLCSFGTEGCSSGSSADQGGGSCSRLNGTWPGHEVDLYGGDRGTVSFTIQDSRIEGGMTIYGDTPEAYSLTASCNESVTPNQISGRVTGSSESMAVGQKYYGIYDLDPATGSGKFSGFKPGANGFPTSFSTGYGQRLFVFGDDAVALTGSGGARGASSNLGGRGGAGGSSGHGGVVAAGGSASAGALSPGGTKSTGGTGGIGGTRTTGTVSGGSTGGSASPTCSGKSMPTATGTLVTDGNYVTDGALQGYGYTFLANVATNDSVSCTIPSCNSSTGCTPKFGSSALCSAGTVAADSTYATIAGLGFNFNQSASGPALSIPAPATVTVTFTNPGGSPLRLQLGDEGSNQYWCIDSGKFQSGQPIPIASFNTKCWDGSGTPLSAGTAITAIVVYVPSTASSAVQFAACLTGVTLGQSPAAGVDGGGADAPTEADALPSPDDAGTSPVPEG